MRVHQAVHVTAPAPERAQEVPPQKTPTSVAEMRDAITRALRKVDGRAPPSGLVDTLVAHASLETAAGASMHNYNFGGIKGRGPSGATASCMTREVLGGQSVRLRQGFRAYASLDEGATDYVLTMRTRFPDALTYAARGDLDGFAHALKSAHYYTAPEAEYASALRSAAGRAGSSVATEGDAPFDAAALARVIDAVSASTARILGDRDDDA